jgi:hypothetical protein
MGAESAVYLSKVLNLISGTTIIGVLYGITFTLYCLCAWSLYLQLKKPDNRRRARFSLGYISFLFFCATGAIGSSGRIIQLTYINHANFPGGPLGYEATYNSTTISCFTIGGTLEVIIEVLTMAIQVGHLPNLSTLLAAEHII